MTSRFRLAIPLCTLLVLTVPAWGDAPRRADLSRLVVVGDSLSAGYQNGSLHEAQQVHGYAAILAAQAGVPLSLPLIAAPGIPNVLTLADPGPPPLVIPAPGLSPGRVDPTAPASNLAVPGHTVHDALGTRPDFPLDSLTDLVLGLPGLFQGLSLSQVEWAEALAPTTVVAWIGNMDALRAALVADPAALTPVPAFAAAYAEILGRLAATGATLVVGNVPDVAAIPFLTAAEDVAALVGAPLPLIGPVLGLAAGDFVIPDAFPLVGAILGGAMAGPLPGGVVLTAAEVAQVREATAAYNEIIAAEAASHGAAVVDIHGLFESIQARGKVAGGQRLTTTFLGGLFSLDGVHPTNTGYAIVADAFIHRLNTRFAAGIAPVNVRAVAREDPLVLPGVGHPARALGHVAPESAASLRSALGRR